MRQTRFFFFFLMMAVMMMTISSCSTTRTITKEVPVEVPVIHRDTVLVKTAQKERVSVRDSIIRLGDTVKIFHTMVTNNIYHDTVYVAKRDTLTKTVYVKQKTEVKEKIPWYKKAIEYITVIIVFLVVGFLLWKVICFIIKRF